MGWPNTENDLVKHQKLANGLEEIRKAWTKDKEMDFKKAPRYKKLIKELFDSLKNKHLCLKLVNGQRSFTEFTLSEAEWVQDDN